MTPGKSSISWKNPPNFVVVGGSEWFLIDRFRISITESASSAGLEVLYTDDTKGLVEFCSSDPWSQPSGGPGVGRLVVFRGYRCEDLSPLREDFCPDPGFCVLYIVDGAINKKSCPVLPKVPESLVFKFNKFSGSWSKTLEFASGFVFNEFKSRGFTCDESLAESMVKTAGFDLGVLNFEIEKAVRLAKSTGKSVITGQILRDTIKPTNHFDMNPMRESLSLLKPDRFLKFTHTAYTRSVSDPTLVLLRGKGGIADMANSWLLTCMLLESGASPDKIASVTKNPEWAVSKDLIPSARRWGKGRLEFLISGLAETEVGFFSGCPNPRVKLESSVVSAMGWSGVR